MGNGLLYVCKKCGKWVILNPAMTLDGCPYCKGELHHVPINMDQYVGWSEEIQQAFQYHYLSGKYNNGVPPVPGLKPTLPAAAPKKQESPARQQAQAQAKPQKQKKSAGCGGAVLSMLLRIVIGIVVFLVFTGGANLLSKYNGLQREASISLNAVARTGAAPTVGSYVNFYVRWAAGPFATETSTYSYGSRYSSEGGITSTVSEKNFYYIVLDDGTVMALETTNAQEIETLNRMNTWLMGQNGFPENGEMFEVRGEIKAMDADVRSYYDMYLNDFGFASGTPNIRYLVLDTTAGREMLYVILGGAALVLVIVLIIVSRVRKKKKKAAAAA